MLDITATYISITPKNLNWVRSNPKRAMKNRPKGHRLDIGVAWNGIHYLLTGDTDVDPKTKDPRAMVVLGGKPFAEIESVTGYYLTPEEVQLVWAVLSTITDDELSQRYDPAAMDDLYIYPPRIWGRDGDKALGFLLANFGKLKGFFRKSAERDNAVLVYIG